MRNGDSSFMTPPGPVSASALCNYSEGLLLPREKATPPPVGHRHRAWQTPSSLRAGRPLGGAAAPLHARSPIGRPHGLNTSTHVCTRPHMRTWVCTHVYVCTRRHMFAVHIYSHMHTLVHAYAHTHEHVHRHNMCAPCYTECVHMLMQAHHMPAHTHACTHTRARARARAPASCPLPASPCRPVQGAVHQPHASPQAHPVTL